MMKNKKKKRQKNHQVRNSLDPQKIEGKIVYIFLSIS